MSHLEYPVSSSVLQIRREVKNAVMACAREIPDAQRIRHAWLYTLHRAPRTNPASATLNRSASSIASDDGADTLATIGTPNRIAFWTSS